MEHVRAGAEYGAQAGRRRRVAAPLGVPVSSGGPTEGRRGHWDQLHPLDFAPLPSLANQTASRHSTLRGWRGA